MSEIEISATFREKVGKAESGRLRRTGRVPCIMYGVDGTVDSISVNKREIEKLLSGSHSIISVNVDGKKQSSVVKEIQYHPVKGDVIHVDLLRIIAGQEVNISVPLKFIGEPAGIKQGGIFQELRMELDITCFPKDLPDSIEVDISHLEIGDTIHVSDLKLENITINNELTSTICSVSAPKKVEEIVEEEEEEAEEEDVEPEVITAKAPKEEENE